MQCFDSTAAQTLVQKEVKEGNRLKDQDTKTSLFVCF